jgi:hypothetical protein
MSPTVKAGRSTKSVIMTTEETASGPDNHPRGNGETQPAGDGGRILDNAASRESATALGVTLEEAVMRAAQGGDGAVQPKTDRDITADNVFDNLAAIRKSDPTELVKEKQMEVHLAVRKPKPKEFFRVCPNREMSIVLFTYTRKAEGSLDEEVYHVLPKMESYLENMEEGRHVQLVFCVTDRGVRFFWPLPLPDSDGSARATVTSARAVARLALTHWMRLKFRKADMAYTGYEKEDQSQEPVWPDKEKEPLSLLLKRAFGKRIIDSLDHPVVKEDLRGASNKPADKEKGKNPDADSWL